MAIELPAYLRAQFPELAAHWASVQSKFKTESIPAQTTLLAAGDVATNLYLIVQGSLRMWRTTASGRDITFQFFFENQPVASFESFYLQRSGKPTRNSKPASIGGCASGSWPTVNGSTPSCKVPRPAAIRPWSPTIPRCSTGYRSTRLRPTWG